MTWFSRLTGFTELPYEQTQALLTTPTDGVLRSTVNGREYQVGMFTMASLAQLRADAATTGPSQHPTTVRIVRGDVGRLHADPEYAGALFQVASQFNALEMTSPHITPDDGVTRYQHDPTQGPACAIAAGAATLYRNYLVPVDGRPGQRAHRQLDGLADLGPELSDRTGLPIPDLWEWSNGYALVTPTGRTAIARHLAHLDDTGREALAGLLRIGIHADVEVTGGGADPGQLVSQAFCSALPVSYGGGDPSTWEPFARLVLDAAYEATLLQGVINARRGGSPIVALTLLGGGAFGNEQTWILDALTRALTRTPVGLDVRVVCYGAPSPELERLVAD